MSEILGLSKRCGFVLLAVALVPMPIALIAKGIEITTFIAIETVWLLASLVMILSESITEITLWKASIKRDVTAAKAAKQDAEDIRDQLRKVTKMTVENSWILASTGLLAMGGDRPAASRLGTNLDFLSDFVEPEKQNQEEWWGDLRKVFADRGVENLPTDAEKKYL